MSQKLYYFINNCNKRYIEHKFDKSFNVNNNKNIKIYKKIYNIQTFQPRLDLLLF